ncbi:MAG TPA: hypothetical protein VFH53_02915, partial [Phycisphaerae bacterium]|nr:hypothetical protein [Phycisphaerae bacterium]
MNDGLRDILARLEGPRQTGENQWQARCPAHDDRHASLSISRGGDGRVLLHCHAGCPTLDICHAAGVPFSALFAPAKNGNGNKKVVAEYDYRDAEGNLLFQTVRLEPKDFRQRRPDGNGGWIWKLGKTPRVLYRLPELIAADTDERVFVVEGEKDADNLAALGLIATTSPMGAGNWHKLSDDSVLHGRRVAILPDKDDAGRKHASVVARALHNRASEVRIVELSGDGKDVSDWIAGGGTVDELLAMAETAPLADLQADDEPLASSADGLVKLGTPDPDTGRLVLSARRTLPTAEAFVREFYAHGNGRTLHTYAGVLMEWRGN